MDRKAKVAKVKGKETQKLKKQLHLKEKDFSKLKQEVSILRMQNEDLKQKNEELLKKLSKQSQTSTSFHSQVNPSVHNPFQQQYQQAY